MSSVVNYETRGQRTTAVGHPRAVAPEFWAEQVQDQESSLFARMRRRKMWFLSTTALTAAAVIGVYSITPKSYRASGTVLVAVSSGDTVLAPQDPQATEKLGDAADMESQLIMLKSPQLLHTILEKNPDIANALLKECQENQNSYTAQIKAYLEEPKSCDVVLNDQDSQVQWMENSYEVYQAGRSRVISVNYTSHDPVIAKLMVNTLIDAYVEQGTADKLRTRSQAAVWIRSELDRLSTELRQGEQNIEIYRRQHGLIKGQAGSIQSESLSSISQQLALAQAQRAQAQAALAQVGKGTRII